MLTFSAVNFLKQRLPFGRVVYSTLILSAGTAIGHALLVAVSPIISRIYTPEDFGIFAVFFSIFGLAAMISTFNFHVALPLPEKRQKAISLTALSLIILLLTTFFITVALVFFRSFLTKIPTIDTLGIYIWFLPPALLFAAANITFHYWLLRERNYKLLSITKIYQSVTMAFTQIGLGILHTPVGLIIGHMAAQFVGIVVMARNVFSDNKNLFKKVRAPDIAAAFREYQQFALTLTPSAMASSASELLPPVFLAAIFSVEVAGAYAFITRIILGGSGFITQSVGKVFYVEAIQRFQESPQRLWGLYLRTCRRLILVGALPFAFLFFFGEIIITFIFGENWLLAGTIASYLAPHFFTFFVSNHALHVFVVTNRLSLKFYWDSLRLLLMLLTFFCTFWFQLNPKNTVILLSALWVSSNLILVLMCARLTKGQKVPAND